MSLKYEPSAESLHISAKELFLRHTPPDLCKKPQTPIARHGRLFSNPRPGVELRANLKSISHRCHLFEVVFVWMVAKETIHLPLGCLKGGACIYPGDSPHLSTTLVRSVWETTLGFLGPGVRNACSLGERECVRRVTERVCEDSDRESV